MSSIKIHHLLINLIFIVLIHSNFQSQDSTSTLNKSIAVIHKNNGETIRGFVYHNDAEKIIINSRNEQKITIPYSQIASIEFISTESLKNETEFKEEHLNYTQNCFFPTGFTTKKGDFTGNAHYGLSGNAKIGISDNFELTAGTVSFFTYFLSIGYSKEIGKVLQLGINGYGGFTFDFNQNNLTPIYCIIPRFSIGNKNRNITMGFIGFLGTDLFIGSNLNYEFMYGGYIAAKNRFKEKWSVSSELASVSIKGLQTTYIGNFTFNFMRNFYSSWSFGIGGIRSEDPVNGIQYLANLPFFPFPYFGYMRRFN